jgi:hypothetical protein
MSVGDDIVTGVLKVYFQAAKKKRYAKKATAARMRANIIGSIFSIAIFVFIAVFDTIYS